MLAEAYYVHDLVAGSAEWLAVFPPAKYAFDGISDALGILCTLHLPVSQRRLHWVAQQFRY